MARPFPLIPQRAAGRQLLHEPDDDPAPSRLGAYICVLALYLAFSGVLLGFGYGLWAALAGATTACVVAGEVSRRVITAGISPSPGPAPAGAGDGLAGLLGDLTRALERSRADAAPGDAARRDG